MPPSSKRARPNCTWCGKTIFPTSLVEKADGLFHLHCAAVAEADVEDLHEKELYTFFNSAGVSGGSLDALVAAVAVEKEEVPVVTGPGEEPTLVIEEPVRENGLAAVQPPAKEQTHMPTVPVCGAASSRWLRIQRENRVGWSALYYRSKK